MPGIILSGCGGGGGNVQPVVSPSAGIATISGRVEVPAGLAAALPESGTSQRAGALTNTAALAGATVIVGRMNNHGVIEPIAGLEARTGADGTFTIGGAPAEKNLIIQATRDIAATTTVYVRAIVSVAETDVGKTKGNITVNTESTLAVEVLKNICAGVETPAKDIDDSIVSSMSTAVSAALASAINDGAAIPDLTAPAGFGAYLNNLKTQNTDGRWQVAVTSAAGQSFTNWIIEMNSAGAVTSGAYTLASQNATGTGTMTGNCFALKGATAFCGVNADQTIGGRTGKNKFFIFLKFNNAIKSFSGTWSSTSAVFGSDKGAFNSITALTTISVSPASVTVSKGNTHQLAATAAYVDQATGDVTLKTTWSSSNPAVATVANGLVTAVSAGTAQITAVMAAQDGGTTTSSASIKVVDMSQADKMAPVNMLATPSQNNITISWQVAGDCPATTELKGFNIYRSATSGSGYVKINSTLIDKSQTTYTDSAVVISTYYYYVMTSMYDIDAPNESAYSAEARARISISAIAVAPTSLTISVGNTRQFTAVATYQDQTTRDITNTAAWASTNPGAASIANGLLTTVSAGETRITAETQDSTSAETLVYVLDMSRAADVAPRNVAATAQPQNNTIGLSWQAPNVGPAISSLLGYNAFRSTSSGGGYAKINTTSLIDKALTAYTDTDVAVGTNYYYVMTAVYDIASPNESAHSAEAAGRILTGEEAIRAIMDTLATDSVASLRNQSYTVYSCAYTAMNVAINGTSATVNATIQKNYSGPGEDARTTSVINEVVSFTKSGGVWSAQTPNETDYAALQTRMYANDPAQKINPASPVFVIGLFGGAGNNLNAIAVTDSTGDMIFLPYSNATTGRGWIKAPSATGDTTLTVRAKSTTGKIYEFTHTYTVDGVYGSDQSQIVGLFDSFGAAVRTENINSVMALFSPAYNDGTLDYTGARNSYLNFFNSNVTYSSKYMVESINVAGSGATVVTREVREFDDSPNPLWVSELQSAGYDGGPVRTTREQKRTWTLSKSGGPWQITSYTFNNGCLVFAPLTYITSDATVVIADCYDSSFNDITAGGYILIPSLGEVTTMPYTFPYLGMKANFVDTPPTPGLETIAVTALDTNGNIYRVNLSYNLAGAPRVAGRRNIGAPLPNIGNAGPGPKK